MISISYDSEFIVLEHRYPNSPQAKANLLFVRDKLVEFGMFNSGNFLKFKNGKLKYRHNVKEVIVKHSFIPSLRFVLRLLDNKLQQKDLFE